MHFSETQKIKFGGCWAVAKHLCCVCVRVTSKYRVNPMMIGTPKKQRNQTSSAIHTYINARALWLLWLKEPSEKKSGPLRCLCLRLRALIFPSFFLVKVDLWGSDPRITVTTLKLKQIQTLSFWIQVFFLFFNLLIFSWFIGFIVLIAFLGFLFFCSNSQVGLVWNSKILLKSM